MQSADLCNPRNGPKEHSAGLGGQHAKTRPILLKMLPAGRGASECRSEGFRCQAFQILAFKYHLLGVGILIGLHAGEGFLDKPVSGGARQQNVTDLQIGRELQLDRDETKEATIRADPHEFGRADQTEEPKGGCSFDTGAAMQVQIHQGNAQIRSKMVGERGHSQLQDRMRHFGPNFPASATHMKQFTDDTEGSQTNSMTPELGPDSSYQTPAPIICEFQLSFHGVDQSICSRWRQNSGFPGLICPELIRSYALRVDFPQFHGHVVEYD